MEKITRDRGSLFHDDRIDALAGSVRNWVQDLSQDDEQAKYQAQRKAYEEMMANPLGNGRSLANMGVANRYPTNHTSSIAALKRRW